MRLDSIYIRKGKAWVEKYFAEMEKENSAIKHYGVKGMKWGVRRTPEQLGYKKRVANYLKNSTIVRDAIRSGKVSKRINREKQLRHTKTYHIKGRSHLDGDLEFAQRLVDEFSGTGRPLTDRNGNWYNRERVICPENVGMHVDQTGKETPSNIAIIIYSKTGSHVYPGKRGGKV